MKAKTEITESCQTRALRLVRKTFGSIGDLPKQLWPVVWVTTYRSCEVAMLFEASGGPSVLVKSALLEGGKAGYELERSILRFELLKELIPAVRGASSTTERMGISQLLIDILKWDIENAGESSVLRRTVARQFAKADTLYKVSIPSEML